jgi:hypothetical protein
VREAIEAHLTIVFTALAVSHAIQRKSPKPNEKFSPTSASTPGTKRNVQTRVRAALAQISGPDVRTK